MAEPPERPLRRGWTTGACATAAATAAFAALQTGRFPDPVEIRLPRGERPSFPLALQELEGERARAGIVKDAGDDPDVTHGALIVAAVRRLNIGSDVRFLAGKGVGTITRPGLPLAVGEPAINPKPREMIRDNLRALAGTLGTSADLEVEISIPEGEALALKTWNPRLGIVGGLSVLGTTGIVVPYSCSAWIHSIHRGIDVARAVGRSHVAAATGATTEAAVKARYGLPDEALIDMGDFVGGMLKYLRRHPLPRLTIASGFGKLVKLADGHLDLHSKRSQVDLGHLAAWAAAESGDAALASAIVEANNAGAALELAERAGCPLGSIVARRARETALAQLAGETAVEILAYDRSGRLVGEAPA
ncbi:MAG: cobalt-precorrin-5B (C(1))-methyltransferase [Kiloniellales bacterium]